MNETPSVLRGILDQLEEAGTEDYVSVAGVVETFGHRSFAALMLIFALIAVSPLSTLPGVTAAVALVEFLLVTQMIAGRRHVWLPSILGRRRLTGQRLRQAVAWLRRPVAFTERLLRPRLTYLTEKPLLHIWLILILVLTMVMPAMEFLPGSGTLASAVIALSAAAILTHDGALLVVAGLCLVGLAVLVIWLVASIV
jgi:hypothetical protein